MGTKRASNQSAKGGVGLKAGELGASLVRPGALGSMVPLPDEGSSPARAHASTPLGQILGQFSL